MCPVCINETLSFRLGLEGCSLKIRLPWKPKVFSLLGMLLDGGRERCGKGEEQPLQMRHFSKILDLPSVGTSLLLVAANGGREGFISLLDAFPSPRGLPVLCVSLRGCGTRILVAGEAGICGSSGAGSGGDQQSRSPEHPSLFFWHQVPNGRLQVGAPSAARSHPVPAGVGASTLVPCIPCPALRGRSPRRCQRGDK